MLTWIVLALMTLGVVAVLALPLIREVGSRAGDASKDAAVYKDQLRELEVERQEGLINESEAVAARIEISRRLLASADRARDKDLAAANVAPTSGMRWPSYAILVLVPALALPLYHTLGSPHLSDNPHAELVSKPDGAQRLEALVAKVEARLRDHPEDGMGWDVIAPVYFRQNRFRDAADAYERATRILGENGKRLVGYAEALILADNGIVGEPARKAFERALALEPDRLMPRFWLAIALEQDGQLEDAKRAYKALLQRGKSDARWRPLVEARLANIASQLPEAGDDVVAMQGKAERGPKAADIAAAQDMTSDERGQMIRQMVDGLAARLAEDGNDLGGWLRLMRSYVVLGEQGKAEAALARAHQAFSSDAKALEQLDDLANKLKLVSRAGGGVGAKP